MYIEPNTSIEIMQDVPLESSQVHQIYFTSKDKRDEYFNSKVIYTVPNTMYQRANSGSVKVQLPIGNLIKCNYMRFKNTSFENRYIYCFITDVDYISNEVTLVRYEIDYVQTMSFWSSNNTMFNFNECIIEREHTVSDELFEHLIPEGINPQLEVGRITNQFFLIKIRICVTYFYTSGNIGVDDHTNDILALGFERRGVIGGDINAMFFKDYSFSGLNSNQLVSVSNNILSDITALLSYGANITYASYIISPESTVPTLAKAYDYTLDVTEPPLNFLIANVKNKKLYSSEFHSFLYTTTDGNSAYYKPELLVNTSGGKQRILGQYVYYSGATSTITFYPNYDKGTYVFGGGGNFHGKANQSKALSLSLTAVPNISTDTFAEWYGTESTAQHTKAIFSLIADGINTLANVASSSNTNKIGNFLQGSAHALGNQIASGVKTIGSYKANIQQAASAQDNTRLASGNLESVVTDRVGFIMYEMTPNIEIIKEIDNYFTMYGYQVNRVAKPTLNNRPQFTYVQTENCTIDESVPNNFKSNVEKLFDRGITFWKNPENIGNYSLDNRPVS